MADFCTKLPFAELLLQQQGFLGIDSGFDASGAKFNQTEEYRTSYPFLLTFVGRSRAVIQHLGFSPLEHALLLESVV